MALKWPWQKSGADEKGSDAMNVTRVPETDTDPYAGYDFNDPNAIADETDDSDLIEDPLAGLDDQTRALVEAQLEAQRQQILGETRASLRQRGFDLTDQGLAMADPQAARQWLGVGEATQQQFDQRTQQQPPPQSAPPSAPPSTMLEDDESDIPDPLTQPREFRKWLRDSQGEMLKQVVQEALGPVAQAVTSVHQRQIETEMDRVMARVPDAVRSFAPAIDWVMEQPGFEEAMRQMLATSQPDDWKDPRNLAIMAGGVIAVLPRAEAEAPAPRQRPRAPQPQNVASRAVVGQIAPSRSAGRNPAAAAVDERHAWVAQRVSEATGRPVTAEEIALYDGDTTGDKAAGIRAKRLANELKQQGGRR